ncbi:MAG TPA: hypothetical protein VNQ73_16760 [Ilumatobacter sp.]|nr:hypothetical protein [Ilumatobacter sp.]
MTRRRRVAVAWAAVVVVATACTGDDDGGEPVAPGVSGPATTEPEMTSPFCTGIAEVTARLAGDDLPADLDGFLADAYQDLLPVAPAELVPSIEALVASLGLSSPVITTVPGTDVTLPPDNVAPPVVVVTPGEQLAEYVAEHCARIDANPGPAATVPSGGIDTVADTAPTTTVPQAPPTSGA